MRAESDILSKVPRFFYDLHIHSCLSPCCDDDMTPRNIANMAALAGLQIIAVADHNTCGNCAAAEIAAREAGLAFVPAMELTTSEEVHVLCLMPDIDAARGFSEYVRESLPDIENNPDIFGPQLIVDENDNLSGIETRMLAAATGIGIYDVPQPVRSYGGVAVLAHADRMSFSVTSNLGFIDPAMGFTASEITRNTEREPFIEANTALKDMRILTDSDAHALVTIYDAEFSVELERPTPECLIGYLRGNG